VRFEATLRSCGTGVGTRSYGIPEKLPKETVAGNRRFTIDGDKDSPLSVSLILKFQRLDCKVDNKESNERTSLSKRPYDLVLSGCNAKRNSDLFPLQKQYARDWHESETNLSSHPEEYHSTVLLPPELQRTLSRADINLAACSHFCSRCSYIHARYIPDDYRYFSKFLCLVNKERIAIRERNKKREHIHDLKDFCEKHPACTWPNKDNSLNERIPRNCLIADIFAAYKVRVT